MALSSPEEHAIHDLHTVRTLREALAVPVPQTSPYATNFTSTSREVQLAQSFRERQSQQAKARRVLSTSDRLYRRRVEVRYKNGDTLRLYLSPTGEAFEHIDATDEDILVSWAAPQFLALRNASIGEMCTIGQGSVPQAVEVVSATEISREEPLALLDFYFDGESGQFQIAEVRIDPKSGRPTVVKDSLPALETAEFLDVREELPEATNLGLGTIVHDSRGRIREIQFALDDTQWDALKTHHDQGTIVLTGPPGAGKTTVAVLRATALIHAAYDDLIRQQNGSTSSKSRFLQKNSFRVVVVTENLRNYLKGTLASSEVALPEAEVVNIRGAFLENFVRHRTLRQWIHGMRFRLSEKANPISDELRFIKAMPETLRLCFYHAVLNARENSGEKCEKLIQRIHDAVAARLEKEALDRVLNEHDRERLKKHEQQNDVDLDTFLVQIGKANDFHNELAPRIARLSAVERQFASFVQRWLKLTSDSVDKAIESEEETVLIPGRDDMLLSRFVDDLSFPEQGLGMRKTFVTEAWRELVRLVDPREVLLRVVDDFEKTADRQRLVQAGLSDESVRNALLEWRATLSGAEETPLDDEDDLDESGSLEDLDSLDPEVDADSMQPPKGAFTRSDFPLLASIARVFLAMPEEAMADPERYKRVGFLLPDEKVRYDHLIIDEGQDFTYAEIHLVRSLVESTRKAITVCGDPLQRMDWRSGFSSLETVRPGHDREFQVQKNYRQTRELCDWVHRLSRRLFGQEATTMEQGGTHGPMPVVNLISEMKEVVPVAAKTIGAWFGEERNPFTAVLAIGFDSGMQTRFTNSLRKRLEDDGVVVEKVIDGRLIERGRVNVCEVPTVKGLEFDGVLVWVSRAACELLRQSTPQARITKNMLYVACSRAKRHLTVVFQGEVPELVEANLLNN